MSRAGKWPYRYGQEWTFRRTTSSPTITLPAIVRKGARNSMTTRTFLIAAAVSLLATSTVNTQTNPTGTLSGRVVDAQNLAVPGVSVTAASPALQGVRTAITSENGDFVLPFLAPGDYAVTFELAGFATVQRTERIRIGETTSRQPDALGKYSLRNRDRHRRTRRPIHDRRPGVDHATRQNWSRPCHSTGPLPARRCSLPASRAPGLPATS